MQKLICINNKPKSNCFNFEAALSALVVGCEYNGWLDEAKDINGNKVVAWYILETDWKYEIGRFAPIHPDASEELVNTKEEVYA
jgi:hypothetical protein